MKKIVAVLATLGMLSGANAQHYGVPYLDQDGLECVFTWNSKTAASALYFYQTDSKEFAQSPYQLSVAVSPGGIYHIAPYLDQDGLECALVWEETSGDSKLMFYQESSQSFVASNYQLPANPTGDAGRFHFEPYLDQDGLECVLVTNIVTGTSKLYFYQSSTQSFQLSAYQLPAKPTEDEGKYYCIPYLDQDGLECVLAYNSVTGKSILYYYSSADKQFLKSSYQLETNPVGDAGEFHFRPYLDQDGLECVLAWNAKTGSSKLMFYQSSTKTFEPAPYQLPTNPTGSPGQIGMYPYLDQDGLECVFTYNITNGKSVLYFYSTDTKQFGPSPYQIPSMP